MPYQCTACGKSFRYKVSQRTHKCPAQPPGTVVRQSGELVQRLLQGVQQRVAEAQTEKHSTSPLSTGKTDTIKESRITSKEIDVQTKSDEICKMEGTAAELGSLAEEHQLPQQNNQFIILLEGDVHHGLPPGLIVATPPLFMLPSDSNVKGSNASWSSLETVPHLTNAPNIVHSNANVIKNSNHNSFPLQNKILNSEGPNSDTLMEKEERKMETKPRGLTSELHKKDTESGEMSNDEWFHMDSENSLPSLTQTNRTNSSNSPDLGGQTTDFFTMVMSPPQTTGLPSPSEGLRQLTISPPDDINHQDQPGALFQFFMPSGTSQTNICVSKRLSSDIQSPDSQANSGLGFNCSSKVLHPDIEASVSLSGSGELHTINEESLKQLLYGSSL